MSDKADLAKRWAESHLRMEPTIERIVRITGPDEEDPSEPIKLLEVNPDTPASGIVPIIFGPSDEIPAPTILVEITPEEYDKLNREELELPAGWKLDATLYDGAQEPHHAGS